MEGLTLVHRETFLVSFIHRFDKGRSEYWLIIYVGIQDEVGTKCLGRVVAEESVLEGHGMWVDDFVSSQSRDRMPNSLWMVSCLDYLGLDQLGGDKLCNWESD